MLPPHRSIRPAARTLARHPLRAAGPLLVALAALAFSCGKSSRSVSPAPPAPPPPGILAVSPPARSSLVDYLADIWAEFDRPLDPATVNTKNVYLKLDTTRLPIAVSWDSTTRRIHVRPLITLALLTTYTVELSPNLRAADGTALSGSYLWQFTTQSVRHPSNPSPADGAMDSPFVTVTWGGNETTPGTLVYELYVGTDSAAVAARQVPMVYRGPGAGFLPRARWHEHGANFWSVTVENQTQGERYNGAVWRFDTPPADAVVDSMDIYPQDYGYQSISPIRTFCQTGELVTGANYKTFTSWILSLVPFPPRFANMRWLLSSSSTYADSLANPVTIWASINNPSCSFRVGGTVDEGSGPLATGVRIGPRTVRFDSDFLAAHMEASVRRAGLYGYFIRSQSTVHFVSLNGLEIDYRPNLRIWFYRLPSSPARAVPAPAAGSGAARPARAGARIPSTAGERAS